MLLRSVKAISYKKLTPSLSPYILEPSRSAGLDQLEASMPPSHKQMKL
jgi:hypothetical protein